MIVCSTTGKERVMDASNVGSRTRRNGVKVSMVQKPCATAAALLIKTTVA